MSRFCPENEIRKREYTFYLEAADGKQSGSIDAALKAISRFEESTGKKPFRRFHVEQARAFRRRLSEDLTPAGKPLSAATVTSTLKHLRNFFLWLSQQPGYRARLKASDASYFTPSPQDVRIASAKRERPVASVDQITAVLRTLHSSTAIEKRDRAIIAFALLTGARDGAISTFRLKHVDLEAGAVFQDSREVDTKRRKTFTTTFFPIGAEPLKIFEEYLHFLKTDLDFGPDDPLFPSTLVGQGTARAFCSIGLTRECWKNADPIRAIFRRAFEGAGMPYVNPHSFRTTLVRLGERRCRTPEEWKSWSQNLGHEHEATTFAGYGKVPEHRQAELIKQLGRPDCSYFDGLDIPALEAFLASTKRNEQRPVNES
jgi:integrase